MTTRFNPFKLLGSKTIILYGLAIFFLLFYLQPQPFINVDLPRHLKNGQIIVDTGQIPRTNLYSYTYPNHPTVMHHWGAGVFFHVVSEWIGVAGLQIVMAGVTLSAVFILFKFASTLADASIVAWVTLLATLLIATRTEVRPEMFSYFLVAVFLTILWSVSEERLNKRWLLGLPLLQILWVNLHVFFIFGIGLCGLFVVVNLLKKTGLIKKIGVFISVLLAVSLASLVNPYGLTGVLAPLTVMTKTQANIVENFNVLQYLNYFESLPYILFVVLLGFTFWLLWLCRSRVTVDRLFLITCLVFVFGGLGIKMVRTIVLFGIIMIPVLSVLLQTWSQTLALRQVWYRRLNLITGCLLLIGFTNKFLKTPLHEWVELGVDPEVQALAEFIKTHDLQGPMLNNFNSGSYLIYHLYPTIPVYVDNRSEAYPDAFFASEYIPLEHEPNAWERIDADYQFNLIFAEVSAQQPEWLDFLTARKDDPQWAVVYHDANAVILLRQNQRNQEIIEEFEIVYE